MLDSQAEQGRGANMRRVMTWTPIGRPRFVVQAEGTTRTIAVHGDLDVASAGDLAALLDAAVAECRRVVVDLSGAEFIDSAGVHLLLRTDQRAHERSVGLSIVPASELVQRVFEVCGVEAILPFAGRTPPTSGRGAARSRA